MAGWEIPVNGGAHAGTWRQCQDKLFPAQNECVTAELDSHWLEDGEAAPLERRKSGEGDAGWATEGTWEVPARTAVSSLSPVLRSAGKDCSSPAPSLALIACIPRATKWKACLVMIHVYALRLVSSCAYKMKIPHLWNYSWFYIRSVAHFCLFLQYFNCNYRY